MESQDYTSIIIKQSTRTSLYGILVLIFSIVLLLTVGSIWSLVLAQLCMSFFCSLTSIIGRRSARFQSTLNVSRYSTWSFLNLIVWGSVGAYSSYLEILILAYVAPPAVAVPVSLLWAGIYLSGLALFYRYLKVSKLFLASVARQGLNAGNADIPEYRQEYTGYQAGNPAPYQPANVAGYRPYSGASQPANYFPPGTNVYYGHPMNNPPPPPPPPPAAPAPAQSGNNYQ